MKDDVIEKLNQEGNDGPGHEFYDDVDFEEVKEVDDELLKYPVIKRYIKPEDDLKKLNDTIEKGGKK